jgi:hypothetical protein
MPQIRNSSAVLLYIFVAYLFNDDVSSSSRSLVSELEIMWKEAVIAYFIS